jgi:hypothetical protein
VGDVLALLALPGLRWWRISYRFPPHENADAGSFAMNREKALSDIACRLSIAHSRNAARKRRCRRSRQTPCPESKKLEQTYVPVQVEMVRHVDEARRKTGNAFGRTNKGQKL